MSDLPKEETMSNRYEGINNYLNKGVIEANME